MLTFTANLATAIGYVVTCGCEGATAAALRYGTYDDAVSAAQRACNTVRVPLPGCGLPEVCPDYPLYAAEVDPAGSVPSVGVSIGNTVPLLCALGLPVADAEGPLDGRDGLYGQEEAVDFLGRVLVALALAPPDAGRPAQGGRFVDCGRSRGYYVDRIHDLHALAQWCVRHGRGVMWS